jgi:Dolichyl-phosphate-mannose-protein mannosyltransferase
VGGGRGEGAERPEPFPSITSLKSRPCAAAAGSLVQAASASAAARWSARTSTHRACLAVLALAALVLTTASAQRSAEYDEQYTLFLTAGILRPAWPDHPFAAGDVQTIQAGHATLTAIASDLRTTDVHPPLYFWAVSLWRRLTGSTLLATRLFSVLCALAALTAVAAIASRLALPPDLAMLLTLGCYGFAYTATIARGFALAQTLTLCGVAFLLTAEDRRSRTLTGGLLLGAATFANYLAVFVLLASPAFLKPHHRRLRVSTALAGEVYAAALPFLLADLWFFLPQRNSRAGQFPPFHILDALQRIARYAAANLFGGLPLYLPAPRQPAAATALAILTLACAALIAASWRHITPTPAARRALLAATAAPPLGLLLLGLLFHNTPIELRYLAFATPFAALLLAGALASLPPHPRRAAIATILAVQAAALTGLITRPETMQPARATAAAAAHRAPGALVLLPRGNDGVGIVGAFALESPPTQRLLLIAPNDPPAQIPARIAPARRVVLALLAQDDASRAALPAMRAALSGPCWRRIADGFNLAAYDKVCDEDPPPWHSSKTSP